MLIELQKVWECQRTKLADRSEHYMADRLARNYWITPWKSSMPSFFEILKGLLIASFVLPTILLLLVIVGMWLLWVIDPSYVCLPEYPYDYLGGDCT